MNKLEEKKKKNPQQIPLKIDPTVVNKNNF